MKFQSDPVDHPTEPLRLTLIVPLEIKRIVINTPV
jgi:hypothetical protein